MSFSFQFAHLVLPENETRNRETSTSTGLMLTQVKSSLPQAFNFTRYSKQKAQQVCMNSSKFSVWCGCSCLYSHGPELWMIHCAIKAFLQRKKKASSYFILPFCCLRLQCPPIVNFFMTLQEPKEFPFSNHDNKHTLKDISVFSHVSMSEKSWHVQSHCTLKRNHIFSVSCTVGCGAQEVFS